MLNLVIGVLLSASTYAAPIPATSSSDFLKSDLGLFRSPEGFSIHAGQTTWLHSAAPEGNRYIQTIYKAPTTNMGVQAALTVRVDKLHSDTSLQKYMRKWLKEYPRLGFKVLNSQRVRVNNKVGFLIDLMNPKGQKQLRQIVFVKNRTAVILTCRDHQKTFRETVKSCNQITRNFDWL